MGTRLATRAKVGHHSCTPGSLASSSGAASFLFMSQTFAFCAFCSGVSKAVNHINESLGPALIKSVSVRVNLRKKKKQHDAAKVQIWLDCFIWGHCDLLLGDQRVGAGEPGQLDDRDGRHRKQMWAWFSCWCHRVAAAPVATDYIHPALLLCVTTSVCLPKLSSGPILFSECHLQFAKRVRQRKASPCIATLLIWPETRTWFSQFL